MLALLSRIKLAALHFNENSGRKQAVNMKGEGEFYIQFPKAKEGGYVVRQVKSSCTYGKIEFQA